MFWTPVSLQSGFRFLKDEYSTYLLNFFQKQNTALIFDTTFQIASMSINCKTYADLEKEAQAVDGFTLDFRTPTYLANLNSSFHWMFPDPVKVFCSLMRCWNQFSDERHFTKEEYVAYKDWLGKNVGVSRYELQTRLAVMRNKKATGFTGTVTYEVKRERKPLEQNYPYACTLCRICQHWRKQDSRVWTNKIVFRRKKIAVKLSCLLKARFQPVRCLFHATLFYNQDNLRRRMHRLFLLLQLSVLLG